MTDAKVIAERFVAKKYPNFVAGDMAPVYMVTLGELKLLIAAVQKDARRSTSKRKKR